MRLCPALDWGSLHAPSQGLKANLRRRLTSGPFEAQDKLKPRPPKECGWGERPQAQGRARATGARRMEDPAVRSGAGLKPASTNNKGLPNVGPEGPTHKGEDGEINSPLRCTPATRPATLRRSGQAVGGRCTEAGRKQQVPRYARDDSAKKRQRQGRKKQIPLFAALTPG